MTEAWLSAPSWVCGCILAKMEEYGGQVKKENAHSTILISDKEEL